MMPITCCLSLANFRQPLSSIPAQIIIDSSREDFAVSQPEEMSALTLAFFLFILMCIALLIGFWVDSTYQLRLHQ